MSKLISSKEAKMAWANGEKLQVKAGDESWIDINDEHCLSIFCVGYVFRLKPSTITINGIEVPAPFEPKEGDVVWCISDDHGCGYCSYNWLKNHSAVIGEWYTEDEIKQVVAALREIFK